MSRLISLIVILGVAPTCIAAMISDTTEPQHLSRLYRAAVDIAMTCYGDPGSAVGIIGDTDGSILKTLRTDHFIPVVLINGSRDASVPADSAKSHKLPVFIMAVNSPMHLIHLFCELLVTIWFNTDANVLIVDSNPGLETQCKWMEAVMYLTTNFAGMLSAQFICVGRFQQQLPIVIVTSNPFAPRAPEVWSFVKSAKLSVDVPPHFMYLRVYQEGGQSCKSINFAKTVNVDGYPLRFITFLSPIQLTPEILTLARPKHERMNASADMNLKSNFYQYRWFIDNIVKALNVMEVISNETSSTLPGINLHPLPLSSDPKFLALIIDHAIIPMNQMPLFAVCQHTHHMSQINKILSVIDEESRIGMWVVYLITFLFFKFFLRQAVMPALLDIVRLTCNTGLTTVPQNVAPTIFLACLFMFVVTLQAIYTGNLSTLLTTTISYPNVQTRKDIAKLGYTIYLQQDSHYKLSSDPSLDGHFIKIPSETDCIEYVLRDPLAVCIMASADAINNADEWNLHVSRNPMVDEYIYYLTTGPNLFKSRIEGVLRALIETGLGDPDEIRERFRLKFVDDDEVKRNTDRRVMTLDDLGFAFVILGVGLLCSSVCFMGEMVVFRMRLKKARRSQVRRRTAWGITSTKWSFLPSLKWRLNLRRLFLNR